MDKERDEYFSPQDADEWGIWSEEQEPEDLDAYLISLCDYYGNRVDR